jgi:methyltransferase-like protein/predicted O-methyltransferase YrrM
MHDKIQQRYDELPYKSYPFVSTHPNHLATIATLFGMSPPAIEGCRVLELGCAAGGNLIPMAQELPGSEFVGIDLSSRQIADGQSMLAALDLPNIRLEQRSILDIGADFGKFDYILCHGVYSWVPPIVQDKILAICHEQLTPQGVAYISYNCLPGWHIRGMVRDMMKYHASSFASPKEQVEQSRHLLNFLSEALNSTEEVYGRLLKNEAEILGKQSDEYLYHEHLSIDNHPIYFHQFAERAANQELQYLGDADFRNMILANLPSQFVEKLKGASLLQQEQYMDFLTNRQFRKTLLCHANVSICRAIPAQVLTRFYLSLRWKLDQPGADAQSGEPLLIHGHKGSVTLCDPITKAAMLHLSECWPDCVSFDDLLAAVFRRLEVQLPLDEATHKKTCNTLLDDMMRIFSVGMLDACVHRPQLVRGIGTHPKASSLARLQAEKGGRVTNQRHELVDLDAVGRILIRRMDGKHSRQDLAQAMQESIKSGTLAVQDQGVPVKRLPPSKLLPILDETLQKMASNALLMG